MPITVEQAKAELAKRGNTARPGRQPGITPDQARDELARREGQGGSLLGKAAGAVGEFVAKPFLDARDVIQQGVQPSEQFPYFRLPESVGERSESTSETGRNIAAFASPAAGGAIGAQLATQAGRGLLGRAVAAGGGTAAGEVLGQTGEQVAQGQRPQIDPSEVAIAGASGAVGQPIGEALGAVASEGVKRLFRGGEQGRQGVQQAIDDLAPFGISPSVAQASGRTALDGVESLLSGAPGGAAVFRRRVAETTDSVAKALDDQVMRLTSGKGASRESVGKTVREGINQYASRFATRSSRLWQALDDKVPSNAPVPAQNTVKAFEELTGPIQGAPALTEELSNSTLARMSAALASDLGDSGAVPYSVLRDLRTAIGQKIGNPTLTSDVTTKQFRRIYAGLSEDLRTAARGVGAEDVWKRANDFTREGSKRLENTLQPLLNKKTNAQIEKALWGGLQDGPEQMRTLMRSLTPDQEDVVVADAIRRMGTARPSQQGAEDVAFSFETFLTNWAKVRGQETSSPLGTSLDVLFKRGRNVQLGQDLDKLARASERMRETSRAFFNPSGTADRGTAQAAMFTSMGSTLAGFFKLPIVLAGSMGATNAGARLMTSPKFVRWLAQSTEIAPNKAAAHIGRLATLAEQEDPGTQEAIRAYLDAMQSPIPTAEAAAPEPVQGGAQGANPSVSTVPEPNQVEAVQGVQGGVQGPTDPVEAMLADPSSVDPQTLQTMALAEIVKSLRGGGQAAAPAAPDAAPPAPAGMSPEDQQRMAAIEQQIAQMQEMAGQSSQQTEAMLSFAQEQQALMQQQAAALAEQQQITQALPPPPEPTAKAQWTRKSATPKRDDQGRIVAVEIVDEDQNGKIRTRTAKVSRDEFGRMVGLDVEQ